MMIRTVSRNPYTCHRMRRWFSSSLQRQPHKDLPVVQVIRVNLAGLVPKDPTLPEPTLTLLTHASEVSDIVLRNLLNARETPTIALDLSRVLNPVALDPISMVLGRFRNNPREYQITGWPKSGKTTFALSASNRRRLVVKTPITTAKKSFRYRLIQPGETYTWNEYEIQTQSHLADMRPIRIWDPPSRHEEKTMELQAAGCVPFDDNDEEQMMQLLEILLNAIHHHADISEQEPAYFRGLGVTERLSSVNNFRTAVGEDMSLSELISACQNGQYGKLLFGDIQPKDDNDDDSIRLHRGEAVVGYNPAAWELLHTSKTERDVQSQNQKKEAKKKKKKKKLKVERPEYPKDDTPIIQFPEHRRCFHCMICAGFIKRDSDKHVYGCAHTIVVTKRYEWILAYFTRMMEAFGSGNHVRYLMKDSLACTLMRKHKLRSRAAVYKKFRGIPEFPMPNDLRPPILRSDKPIPYVPRCRRLGLGKSSCYDANAVRLLDSVPNYQARVNELELRKEL